MTAPTYDDIVGAAALIERWVRRTPVLTVEVPTPTGVRAVDLKLELLQHAGSFKVRGAFTSVLSATEVPEVLVAASGGNHGLAVAHTGRALGIPTRIFVPETAPTVKVDAIARAGAEVDRVGSTYAEALGASREAAGRPGALVLHAYDSVGTVTGQGTLGLEIARQLPDVDSVAVAVGGGGLFAGVARALSGALPSAEVVAVEPEACPTLHAALGQGRPVDVGVGGLAADALGASRIGEIAFETATSRATVPRLVSDAAIDRARRWLWRSARVATEPAGATALASLMTGAWVPRAGDRVCVVVCGGNADPAGL